METNEQQRDGIKEAIKFNTELIRLFIVVIIALTTGISSLTLGTHAVKNQIDKLNFNLLKSAGIIILSSFVIVVVVLIVSNKRKLKKLND